MEGRRIRVLLADDHRIFSEALARMLAAEYDLVGTVGDGRELVSAALQLRPDVVITDLSMPHLNGIEAARLLLEAMPDLRIIILTMHADPEYATHALRAGAHGFLTKTCAADELRLAIQLVLEGRVYVTHAIAQGVVSDLATQARSADSSRLTARQREVLSLTAQGMTMKGVAARLRISRRTAEYHKYRIMKMLDVNSVAGLVAYAVREGIVEPGMTEVGDS